MSTVYRVQMRGSAQSQKIQNTIYYSNATGASSTFSSTRASDIADHVETNVLPVIALAISSQMTFTSLVVDTVNHLGIQQSPITYERSVSIVGIRGGGLDSVALAAVIAFQCIERNTGQSMRVPKRTYIALGPITSLDTNDDQTYTPTEEALLEDVADALFAGLTAGATTYFATRMGVANSSGNGAEGFVQDVLVRPKATFVRSRMAPPTG